MKVPVRWAWWEGVLWIALLASPWVLQSRALLINEIAIVALFAVSLDLILGFTGIVSLGHAAFFGMGAYVAALFAKFIMPDPLVGLLVAIGVSTVLGAVCSTTIIRGSDLTRLMVTLGIGLILAELANKLDWLTGGADGLQGVVMGPLLGRFEFDLYGQTSAAYSLVVLLVLFVLARHLVNSPFGATLKAIRDNRLRAMAIGIPVTQRIAMVYTIAAGMAGAAGALLAQYSHVSASVGGNRNTDTLGYDQYLSKRTDVYAMVMSDKITGLSARFVHLASFDAAPDAALAYLPAAHDTHVPADAAPVAADAAPAGHGAHDADPAAPFVEDKCVVEPTISISSAALYIYYKSWADDSGIKRTLSRNNFTTRLIRLGMATSKGTGGGRVINGITTKAIWEGMDDLLK